jgi:hypothetical protein
MLASSPSGRAVEEPRVLHAGILDDVRALRSVQVRLGRRLLAVCRADRFEAFGATAFPLYCESVGLSAQEGRELATMARAAEVVPAVEQRVAAGEISVQKAATIAPLLLDPGLARPGEDWLATAAATTTRELRDQQGPARRRTGFVHPPPDVARGLCAREG